MIPDAKFPIVPLGTKRAASLPVNSAAFSCKTGEKNKMGFEFKDLKKLFSG